MDLHEYLIDEHVHRFAVWTAARAASRSRLSNTKVETLIRTVNLREAVTHLAKEDALTDESFRSWIHGMGESMRGAVPKLKFGDYQTDYFSFGIAAKIISIYIKTVEVLPTKGESLLSKIAYPPIDSILVRRLNALHKLNLPTTWSKFNWDQYQLIIDQLAILYPLQPKWKIEVLWDVTDDTDPTIPGENPNPNGRPKTDKTRGKRRLP